jgi:hypothetical protein
VVPISNRFERFTFFIPPALPEVMIWPAERIMKKERIPDEKLIRKKERLCRQIADPERSARGQGQKGKRLALLASFPELNPNPVLEVDSAEICFLHHYPHRFYGQEF